MPTDSTTTVRIDADVDPGQATKKPANKATAITAITFGGALELYDSGVYNFFATLIIPLYFPVADPVGQLLLSFGTFGAGYLMRPIGGLVLGAYADRVGRKPAILLSMWLMAFSALILVVTPPYAQLGVLAPILMVLARLIQGFAIGGEMGSASAMLLEYADERSRGFYTSWQATSQGISGLMASLVALTLSHSLSPGALESWGWRIAFLIGILVIPIGQVIRRSLEETLPTERNAASKKRSSGSLLREHWRELVAGVLLMMGLAVAIHVISFYLANYAVFQLHMPRSDALWAGVVATIALVVLSPISGWLCDRVGRRKVVWWSRITLLVAIYPAFAILNRTPTLTCLLVVTAILAVPMAMTSPATMVLVSEVLPQRIRAVGMSVTYYVAIAVFGGFAQMFSTILMQVTQNPNAPALYVIGCGVISLIGLAMVPETLGRRLS
ncbi:MFS transporter [Cupriavidus sp. CP313]